MRDIFTTRVILVLVTIVVVWVGIGLVIYYQTQPGTPATVYTTSTSTITTYTTTTNQPGTSPFNEDEQEYIAIITYHSTRLINAVTTLSTLLGNIQLDDANWVTQATAQADILIALDAEIESVATPYSMVNIHYNYVYATSAYKSAAEAIKTGILDQNGDLLQQGVALMNSGAGLFDTAINLLNEFIASHQ
jgi:hypothetical protein